MAAIQPPLLHWLIAGALAAGAAAALRYGFRAWREGRLIEDTPTSRIRSAAQGYVEFSGRSRVPPDAPIKGPLTGIPCAWWRYQVEELRSSGRARRWVRINGGASEAPFLVDDGTGQCLVDPRGAQVFPHTSDVWYGPDPWPEVRIPAGTGIFGRVVDALLGGGYRYTEHRLSPDAPLLAIGEFRMQGGSFAQDPEQQAAALLHDWKNDQATLLARFDANHDGVLSAAEWDLARAAARRRVQADGISKPIDPGVQVLAEPGDGRAFLLAAADGESLAWKFKVRGLAGVAAFIAAAAACAWVLSGV